MYKIQTRYFGSSDLVPTSPFEVCFRVEYLFGHWVNMNLSWLIAEAFSTMQPFLIFLMWFCTYVFELKTSLPLFHLGYSFFFLQKQPLLLAASSCNGGIRIPNYRLQCHTERATASMIYIGTSSPEKITLIIRMPKSLSSQWMSRDIWTPCNLYDLDSPTGYSI